MILIYLLYTTYLRPYITVDLFSTALSIYAAASHILSYKEHILKYIVELSSNGHNCH